MNSKERVLRALARQETDRVPINYYANADIDRRLKEHFGLSKDDYCGLMDALHVDFRSVGAPYRGPKLYEDIPAQGVVVDNFGIHRRWVKHATGGYWDYCDFPLQDADEEKVANWRMPSPDDFDYDSVFQQCRKNSEFFTVVGGPGSGDIINSNGMLRTMEQVLVDLVSDDPVGLLLIDRKLEVSLEIMRRTLAAGQGLINLLHIGEDLGTQRGPTISLELFRKHIRPRLQKFVDLGRQWKIPVMIHSCGSSSWAFDDFIEMGISVVDTLQPEAKDMAPSYLKKKYGDRLAFHGMISTAGPLAYGTVDDVVKNVRETLDVMMPGGGYMLAPTHTIQDNSPTENVLAMYETASAYWGNGAI